jgi:hypothetical protein
MTDWRVKHVAVRQINRVSETVGSRQGFNKDRDSYHLVPLSLTDGNSSRLHVGYELLM